MKSRKKIGRRDFIKQAGKLSAAAFAGGYLLDTHLWRPSRAHAASTAMVFLAKNGSPAENIAKVIDMRYGGIEHFIGQDDVVVINPNGQWPQQGGSNCACCMGLIDLILQRPGGFSGEILFVECVQFQTEQGSFWGTDGIFPRNGPYNFNDMISSYQNDGHANVNGVRLLRNQDDASSWPVIAGAHQGQGWVRSVWYSPTAGRNIYITYPVIRSPYSNKLIDMRHGVHDDADGYAGQPRLRFIKMPNLNNHGGNAQQDYAGITSAVKSFLGITELQVMDDTALDMHTFQDGRYGPTEPVRAFVCGECVGAWMNHNRRPDAVITTAEWVGWGSRTGSDATQARTVGLCDDPATLDYYMAKHVLAPLCPSQPLFDPDHDIPNNHTRQTINGCISQGIGTANPGEINAFVYDFYSPRIFRFDIDRKIRAFNEGLATEQQVQELIEQFMQQGG